MGAAIPVAGSCLFLRIIIIIIIIIIITALMERGIPVRTMTKKHETSRKGMGKSTQKIRMPIPLNSTKTPKDSWILSLPKLIGMLADAPKLCPTSRVEGAASRNPQVCDKLQRHVRGLWV